MMLRAYTISRLMRISFGLAPMFTYNGSYPSEFVASTSQGYMEDEWS